MKRKLLKLDFEYDFNLLGIVSTARHYHLCWAINKELSLNFNRTDDVEIIFPKTKKHSYFSVFRHKEEENEFPQYLITNKGSYGYFVPERKETDFFLMLNKNHDVLEIKKIMKSLKKVSIVQAVYEIHPLAIKSKENFIF